MSKEKVVEYHVVYQVIGFVPLYDTYIDLSQGVTGMGAIHEMKEWIRKYAIDKSVFGEEAEITIVNWQRFEDE